MNFQWHLVTVECVKIGDVILDNILQYYTNGAREGHSNYATLKGSRMR